VKLLFIWFSPFLAFPGAPLSLKVYDEDLFFS